MYTMALVHRRDITSIRDLKKKDVPWLKALRKRIPEAICKKYLEIEEDQIKLYVHCISPSSLLYILIRRLQLA
jgi:m7GpppX diphosphatase